MLSLSINIRKKYCFDHDTTKILNLLNVDSSSNRQPSIKIKIAGQPLLKMRFPGVTGSSSYEMSTMPAMTVRKLCKILKCT